VKMNRLQFQPGISLNQFLAQYGHQEQCEAAVEAARWPGGFQCPGCGSHRHCCYRRGGSKIFQCSHCRKQTTLTQETIFHSTKLPLTAWFQCMYLLTQNKTNLSALELKRFIGVSYRSAWRMKHKLMQVMFEREQSTKLSERVELDDAYLGGENEGGKRGRGSENKVPFVAAIQTNKQNHPLYAVFSPLKAFSNQELKGWATQTLAPSTLVVTDGLWCFSAVTQAGCVHEPNIVGKGRRSTSLECFTWVNTILGNLKTAITGTYHAFNFEKYPHRYLGEYQYRFNRRFDLAAMLPRLLVAAARTSRRPEAWLRLAEDWR